MASPNNARIIKTITDTIDNQLQKTTNASASATCMANLGSINLEGNGCKVIVSNRCRARSQAIDSTAEGLADAWVAMSNADKKILLPEVPVDAPRSEIVKVVNTKISERCLANASIALSIAQGPINIKGCTDSVIKNINAGDAEANCGIKMFIDDVNKNATTSPIVDPPAPLANQNIWLIGGLGIACICIALIIIILIFVFMK